MNAFSIASTPQFYFGNGKISVLPATIKKFGSKVLLITGARSFLSSSHGLVLMDKLYDADITIEHFTIEREPTPLMVDTAVTRFSQYAPHVIVAIGGGSVLDAGKAISAMLPLNAPVKDYLEGVGLIQHPGTKVPFIALPTTFGTGSEATKNAVLSETGPRGFKKSLRHDNFVPNVAIVDPILSTGCPPSLTASCGMDAFTQLLESYLSTSANPMTDALAYEGLKHISTSLLTSYYDGENIEAREKMALASYLSGITLANAGLGLVHGFASSVGGHFDVGHGVICSSLMSAANKVTIRKLRADNSNKEAILKYAMIGELFTQEKGMSTDYYIDSFLSLLNNWTIQMNIPTLAECGVLQTDFAKIVEVTGNKNNPVPLNHEEMMEVLEDAYTRVRN